MMSSSEIRIMKASSVMFSLRTVSSVEKNISSMVIEPSVFSPHTFLLSGAYNASIEQAGALVRVGSRVLTLQ